MLRNKCIKPPCCTPQIYTLLHSVMSQFLKNQFKKGKHVF